MTPERWKQVSRLFKSAVERGPAERAAFLAEACGDDSELRGEVESLIESLEKAEGDGFIGAPAVELDASSLADDEGAALVSGQRIGHYEVIEKLGEGGMGEVYLARDSVLERQVALKTLPPGVASNRERMHRFEREARAASNLNHPNILTVYEVGESGALQFIATEFVRGMTLRDRIRDGQLETSELLDIAVQTASALAAAHEAGVVHRDVKPENLMLRPDGYVKVLDFGIAKLTEKPTGRTAETEAETAPLLRTAPGLVLGTVSYMSPEQVRGREVDARTDVWSLGVVLYEMVAGRPPFPGETHSDIISLVLQKDPPPLERFAPEAPEELRRIVGKALTKDRELRYQTARDLQIDLQRLKRQLEFEAELERSSPPHLNEKTVAAQKDAVPVIGRKQRPLLTVAFIAALVAALAAGLWSWRSRRQADAPPAASTQPAPVAAAPAPERSLSYWITVQKFRDDKPYQEPFRLAGEINFEKDYRIRLHVASRQSGHLYVLNEGPNPSAPLNVLFPSPTANNGEAVLPEGRQVQIPEKSWFRFDQEAGTEKIWLVWSASPVAELEAVKKFVNSKDEGAINDPALDRAAREFLNSRAASKPDVKEDADMKQTGVAVGGDVLVYPINLLHH